ncbi:hypothetical protein TRFO_04982 [Tritrichomonas foetus]|uniref:Viral A-type inclusion protein n=1 Tax=Tritrichomonas foetus TaxID=1144522 RepID=A0A1J4KBQ5_9EUKA|nr:hypothetical protein TRFO_04982 [Tritrichomonas foetus]|eukprot:OHT08344.1 hypothetical protein TRFO_04982 [Tritrichomonas foetus]
MRLQKTNDKNGDATTKMLSPHPMLDSHDEFGDENNDENIIKNLNNEDNDDVIDRIAEKLQIKTPTSESVLVKTISNKISKLQTMKDELIETFELPRNTHTEYVVTALSSKFSDLEDELNNMNELNNQLQQNLQNVQNNAQQSNQNNNQQNNKNADEDKIALQEQLQDAKNELMNAQQQMKALQKEIEKKDKTISIYEGAPGAGTQMAIEDLNTELINMKIEHAKLKSDFDLVKCDNSDLERENEKIKEQLNQFVAAVKELQRQNETLKKKLSDSHNYILNQQEQNQISSQQEKQEQIRMSEDQLKVFDSMVAQFESQSDELLKEASLRVTLLDVIQKSSSLNQIYENRLVKAEQRIAHLTDMNNLLAKKEAESAKQSPISSPKSSPRNSPRASPKSATKNFIDVNENEDSDYDPNCEKVDESLIETIKTVIEPVGRDLRNTLLGICNNDDLTIVKRIVTVISTLAGDLFQRDNYDENNGDSNELNDDRIYLLINTIGSLVKFINDTVNSKEIQTWALSKYSFDDASRLMSYQADSIGKFIKENCIDIRNDSTNIFSAFIEKHDPYQLEQTLTEFISKFEDIRTNEGKCLLVLLHQALSAGMLMEMYSMHATMQCDLQSQTIRNLRQNLSDSRKRIREAADEMEATKQELLKYQSERLHRTSEILHDMEEPHTLSDHYTEDEGTQTKQSNHQTNQDTTNTNTKGLINANANSTNVNTNANDSTNAHVSSNVNNDNTNMNANNSTKIYNEQNVRPNDGPSETELSDFTEERKKAFDNINEISVAFDDQYIIDMQKKLDETRKEVTENKSKLDRYRKIVRSVKVALRKEFLAGNQSPVILDSFNAVNALEESDSTFGNPGNEIMMTNDMKEHLEQVAKDASDKLKAVEKENNSLKEQIAQQNLQVEQINARANSAEKLRKKAEKNLKETTDVIYPKIDDLQQRIEKTTADYEEKLAKVNEENEQLRILIQKLKQKAQAKFSEFQETNKSKQNKLREAFKRQKKSYEDTIADLNKELESIKKEHESSADLIKEAKAETEEVRQKLKLVQVECKLVQAKLAGKDEELKRDKTIVDSQWKLKQLGLQASTQNIIDSHKKELDERSNNFLIGVANLFKEFVDVKKTLTFENVYQMLVEASRLLENYSRHANELDRIKVAMTPSKMNSTTQNISFMTPKKNNTSSFMQNNTNMNTNAKNGNDDMNGDLSKTVGQAVQQNEIMRMQLDSVENENLDLKKKLKAKDLALISRATTKDWENWALPFYKKLLPTITSLSQQPGQLQNQPNSYVLRSILGDALRQQIKGQTGEDVPQKKKVDRPMLHISIIVIAALRLQRMTGLSKDDIHTKRFRSFGPNE